VSAETYKPCARTPPNSNCAAAFVLKAIYMFESSRVEAHCMQLSNGASLFPGKDPSLAHSHGIAKLQWMRQLLVNELAAGDINFNECAYHCRRI